MLDKPGELEAVRCVTAVVDLPGRPYAVGIMTTYLQRDADGEAAIREISAALYETFDRLARSSDLGRVIQREPVSGTDVTCTPGPPCATRSSKVSRRRMRRTPPVLDHDLRGPRPHVVVGGHDEAVGARVADGQQRRPAPRAAARGRGRGSRALSQTGPTTSTVARRRAPRAARARCDGRPRRAPAAAGRSSPRPRSRTACRGSP